MAFIDTSDTLIGVEIDQIDARYVRPGQEVEVTFKFVPGHVYTGKVESILQAIATGQTQTFTVAATDASGAAGHLLLPQLAEWVRSIIPDSRLAAPQEGSRQDRTWN